MELRVGGRQQLRLVLEVAVRRRSRDRRRFGGVFDRRRFALRNERPCVGEQGIPRSQLLVRPSGIEVGHFLDGTMVPSWYISTMKQIIRGRGEGELRWFFGGGVHEWKVRSDEANGSLFVLEDTLVRGKTTPLHSHPHDELVYVIEGEIVCFGEGTERRAGAGSIVFNPREPHTRSRSSRRRRVSSPSKHRERARRSISTRASRRRCATASRWKARSTSARSTRRRSPPAARACSVRRRR